MSNQATIAPKAHTPAQPARILAGESNCLSITTGDPPTKQAESLADRDANTVPEEGHVTEDVLHAYEEGHGNRCQDQRPVDIGNNER